MRASSKPSKRGWCTQKQRPPHMELTLQHNHHRHHSKKEHQSSVCRPSSASGAVHIMETLPATVEGSQRPTGSWCRGSEIHSNSRGIHTVLATHPPEQIPDTAASKELDKGNTEIICMQATCHPPSCPFTQAECALRLGPQRPFASTTSFMEPKGERQQTSESEERRGVYSISLMLTLASYKIIRQFV